MQTVQFHVPHVCTLLERAWQDLSSWKPLIYGELLHHDPFSPKFVSRHTLGKEPEQKYNHRHAQSLLLAPKPQMIKYCFSAHGHG